jgi:hypothetical protein
MPGTGHSRQPRHADHGDLEKFREDPDLGRAGEVSAYLDERRPEVLVPQVEVAADRGALLIDQVGVCRASPPCSGATLIW